MGSEEINEKSLPDSLKTETYAYNKLSIKDLNAWFGNKQALRNINLNIKENSVTAFIGPSGCGKTTLIRCLNRMHEMTPGAYAKGQVILDGINIYDKSVDPVSIKRRIGMVFQKPNPFPTMSIYDNVAAGLKLNGVKDKKMIQDIVKESLEGAALLEEVKNELDKPGDGIIRRSAAAPLHCKSTRHATGSRTYG